ncbi:17187_t:CDS:2 [Entrophospora sp. SA101]|nr:1572_t:CDS:2 [Entrophospora sp. SA101]CAJ0828986.1 17187_t:CDS:2 [Entrophospora sp. SA101]CAJ0866630.1 3051_t:CDS:2 [Entrophospora sp. SA101]
MSTQNISSAFPEPPFYYKQYTNENLALLKQLKEQQQLGNEEKMDTETEVNHHNHQNFNLLELEPPKPITDSEYYMFGVRWTVEDKLLSLEEQNFEQLYPENSIDRVVELKKLSISTIFNFVELLEIMVKEPEKSLEKFEQIRLLIINMKHLLNEYRPHQARDTLRLIMEDQLKRRREATKEIER